MKTILALILTFGAVIRGAEANWTVTVDDNARFGVQQRVPVTIAVADVTAQFSHLRLLHGGRVLASLEFVPARAPDGEHVFVLKADNDNRTAWASLLTEKNDSIPLTLVAVDANANARSVATFCLKRASEHDWKSDVMTIFVLLCVITTVLLGWKTKLLREPGPPPTPGKPRFSLGRCQIATWTLVVIWSFLYVWAYLGETPPITNSVLALLGIASGTALGGGVISASKRAETLQKLTDAKTKLAILENLTAAKIRLGNLQSQQVALEVVVQAVKTDVQRLQERSDPRKSVNIFKDILSDGDGISIHRFQFVAWTATLVFVFIVYTMESLALREFDSALLALMGISSGAYLGLKISE